MDEAEVVVAPQETAIAAPVVQQSPALTGLIPTSLREMNMLAKMYASASIAPQTYRNKPSDCFVAIEMATRIGVSPMFVMQNSYIVSGNFTWSGKACISLINNCGRFYPLEFEEEYNEETGYFSCVAFAEDRRTGQIKKSTKVDKTMAESMGWLAKNGSYWKTMPQQMARYRAAAYFARAYCPETLNGFYTDDEMRDIKGYEANNEKVKITMEDK